MKTEMTKKDFEKIVKMFSLWKIKKSYRFPDYKLPSGKRLSDYLLELTLRLMKNNNLGFRSDMSLGVTDVFEGKIFTGFSDNEIYDRKEQKERAEIFVHGLIYGE